MLTKGFPSIMREVFWLLVLFPWLVQAPLEPSTTESSTADSSKCRESYAWDDLVNDCIPCSVCISYPQSPFCSECFEFIPHESTTKDTVPGTPGPDSEVNLESFDTGVDKVRASSTGQFVIALTSLIGCLGCLVFTVTCHLLVRTTCKRRPKGRYVHCTKLQPEQHAGEVHELVGMSSSMINESRLPVRSELANIDLITNVQMPQKKSVHFVPEKYRSVSSDSGISMGKTGRCIPDVGCTEASSTCHVKDVSQREEGSCVVSSSVLVGTCVTTGCNSDSTIITIAQMPQKKSVHSELDRHLSDSDSDISMGKTGSSVAESGYHTRTASGSSNMTNMPQWEEESCDESYSSKSSIITSSCNWVSFIAEALIGKDGGILMLPNAATSLLFSPHSISNQIDITLEILHNPVVLPDLHEDETLVSPFVWCGPHGWTFHKPVLLTFPHCGMSDKDDFTLLVSETSSQQAPEWMEVSSATPGIEYFVRDSECLVYTSSFTGFTLKSKGHKQVRLLAFSSVSDNLYRLRVYCINDTKDVIDRIKKEEQDFGFKPTDRGISMTFLNNKKDLHLKAHLETPGWKFLNSSELVINYESVRGKRDGNVLFKLQAEPEHKRDTAILSLSIHAFQEGNSDSQTYSVAEELPVGQPEMLSKLGHKSYQRCDHKGACNCNYKTPSQVYMVHTDITNQARESFLYTESHRKLAIPHKLRTQLCIKLDPKKDCGNDWRCLASELGLDYDHIVFFDSKDNPTERVLQKFDMSGKTLKDLRAILLKIERPDAAQLVHDHLQTTNNDSGVGSPDTDASERDNTPSPASDKKFFPNRPSQVAIGERNTPPYLLCGESAESHELNMSCAKTSERSSPPSDKKFFPNGHSKAGERNCPPYLQCGQSVSSHGINDSDQDATEPKLIQELEEEEVDYSVQGLALNSTGSDNDEPDIAVAAEVNGFSTANPVMSQDDQETKVMVVTKSRPKLLYLETEI